MLVDGKSKHGGDIYQNKVLIDFSANINPFGMPKEVKDTYLSIVDDLSIYPDPYCYELRLKIAEKEHVDISNIICGNGASEIIYDFAACFRNKKALIISPTFIEYEESLKINDIEIDHYLLKESLDFLLDDEIYEVLKNNHYDLIYLCNPNNPTGTLTSKDKIIRLLDFLKENNTILFLDECFNDFIDEPTNYSLVGEINNYSNLFILKAFTKNYGMAGIRLGYGISSNKELLNNMSHKTSLWNVSTISQKCGLVALSCGKYLKDCMDYLRKEREYLLKGLKTLPIKIYPPKANYIFFRTDINLKELLLEKGILIRSCDNYYGLDDNYYRIAVKKHEENMILIKELKEIYHG